MKLSKVKLRLPKTGKNGGYVYDSSSEKQYCAYYALCDIAIITMRTAQNNMGKHSS